MSMATYLAGLLNSSGLVPNSKLAFDGGSLSMRNRIINGDMRIDQRNAGASLSVSVNSQIYTVDRWYGFTLGAALAYQRVSGPSGLQITGATSNTYAVVGQKIESNNIADLAGTTVTISVNAKSSSITTLTYSIDIPTALDNYTSVTNVALSTITISPTAATYSFQVALPAGASNGLRIEFRAAVGITTGTLTLTNMQLEAGTAATSFERRLYGLELALCQRYYEKSYDDGTTPGTATNASITRFPYGAASSLVFANAKFKVSKRAIPSTVRTWDEAGNLSRMSHYNGNTSALTSNLNALASNWGGANEWGFSASTATAAAPGTYTVHWDASAEL